MLKHADLRVEDCQKRVDLALDARAAFQNHSEYQEPEQFAVMEE